MAESYRPPPSCDLLWGQLNRRQRAIVSLLGQGHTNKQVAAKLALSERTVRVHITAIAFLLGCDRERDARLQIAAWWARCGERPAA